MPAALQAERTHIRKHPDHLLLLLLHKMLASAGRRYLITLLNNAHNLPHPTSAGCLQQPVAVLTQQACSRKFTSDSEHDSTTQQQQQQQQQETAAAAAPPAPPPQEEQPDAEPLVAPVQQQQQQRIQQPFAGAMGPRKVDPSVFGGSKGPRAKREGVVHVNSTANNTHLVLTDRASKVETWVSGGTVGYKNANKATPMAAELAAKELARRAIDKGFHSVVVKLKGMGKNKQFAVQSLAASGLTVTQIWDVTPIPYNGCRLPRRRRV